MTVPPANRRRCGAVPRSIVRAAVAPRPVVPSGRTFGARSGRSLSDSFRFRILIVGVVAGVFGGLIFQSFLAAFAFFVLFALIAIVWIPGEPALAFCLGYQWLFTVTAYLYNQVTGEIPGFIEIGDLRHSMFLSLLGLVALGTGIQTMLVLFHAVVRAGPGHAQRLPAARYEPRRLFWLTVVVNAISWLHVVPIEISFNFAQVLVKVLDFRNILFFVFLLAVLQRRQGYGYAVVLSFYLWLPSLSSRMSAFSGLFFTWLLAFASEWRRGMSGPRERRSGVRRTIAAAGLALMLFLLAIVWCGGMKSTWRQRVNQGEIASNRLTAATQFLSTATEAVQHIDLLEAIRELTSRVSSGECYFSFIVQRVPEVVPHERGTLTWRMVQHVLMPRFLFPEKSNLGADSWLVRKYAGRAAAGEEQDTSIGLGYMAEFYIDFGVPGMFLAIYCFGLMIGLLYKAFSIVSPSYDLYRSTALSFSVMHLLSFDGEIAKLMGGMIQGYFVFAFLLYLVGPTVHRISLPTSRMMVGRDARSN